MGWQVVWILHDQRYNQLRLSTAEIALRSSPHFFTNMDQLGTGIIYDQFDICEKGLRLKRLPPLSIDIKEKISFDSPSISPSPLILLKERIATWKLAFAGDLLHFYIRDPQASYWKQAIEMEKLLYSRNSFHWYHLPIKLWQWGIVKPYQIFFHFLLERSCR